VTATAPSIPIEAPPLRYEPALDGIRALAVLVVMFFHYGAEPYLHGGVITVDWFFVLSGFLITNLLLDERNRAGTVSLRGFYHRRILRLFPAMYFFLGFILLLSPLLAREVEGIYVELAAAAAYSYQLLLGFIGFGTEESPRALQHLWTLSVEEWFYFFWPMALLWGIARQKNQRVFLTLCGLFIGFWMVVRLSAGFAGVDFTRDFNDTDPWPEWMQVLWRFSVMRFDVLVMGCLLAIIRRRMFPLSDHLRRLVSIAGIFGAVTVLGFLFLSGRVPGFEPFGSIGYNIALFGVAGSALWLHFNPESRTGRLMSTKFLVHTGKRSYGLYLWHMVPLVVFKALVPGNGPAELLVVMVLSYLATFGLAELSWKFVEGPFLKRKHSRYANVSGR
jgi:peptidoglycan/LPS O-acetylase OafA/YrhL